MKKGRESKPHIGIFGRRNNGKSSLINVLTGQDLAIVSDTPGTTTDPVKKSMEITGVGPVVVIDTAGLDDTGELGQLRIRKTKHVLSLVDMAILVIAENVFDKTEIELINDFISSDIPYLVVHNKEDLEPVKMALKEEVRAHYKKDIVAFSAVEPNNLEELITAIQATVPPSVYHKPSLLGDLLSYGDIVLLITPIDIEAPEGRMILPQVQAIRDILDNDCVAIVLKEREVDGFLRQTGIQPKLVVTDSQVFRKADASIPSDVQLTSFSIMLARLKGDFDSYLKGTPKIADLKEGDRILILESCTHHVSCDDIGRVKIPRWINQFTGKKLEYDVVAGLGNIERPIEDYALVIQCGGCMITQKQLKNRLRSAIDRDIPVTNYGMAIAYVQGIYDRAVAPFVKVESEDYI